MAIAASKLGLLVLQHWDSEEALVRELRDAGLVKRRVSDSKLKDTFKRARDEHAALPDWQQQFNSPNERVRVFLAPLLTREGRRWAEPFAGPDSPWWKFWG